jgi:leucyl aminopeptidase (aminopeptidase T)
MTSLPETYAEELIPGARNAVRTCLRVQPGERVALITDRETAEIAASLAGEIREAGALSEVCIMEDFGLRPMLDLPAGIREALEHADVSIYAGQPKTGELAFRRAMTAVVDRRRIRHAHMVSISRRIMCEAMRADFNEVDALSQRVRDRAAKARRITAKSPAGSDLVATFDPEIRWLKTSGLISPEKWANLPGGEVLTAPARVDGTYVCDGVVGDWLAARYGDLGQTPLTIEIDNSRIVGLACERKDLIDDFRTYTRQHENSDRVGEFALGTNLAVRNVIGEILQDEKIPGVHIAFGHPYSEHTGARWSAPSHIDVVGRSFDVAVDGEPIMRDSRYLVDLATLR